MQFRADVARGLLELPASFGALKSQMQVSLDLPFMFAKVGWIWHEQDWFFRHTLLQDGWTAQAMNMRCAARAHAVSAGPAGSIYFLMGPLHGWDGRQRARARERAVGA